MTTIETMEVDEVEGWSEWIAPAFPYLMACCDCGLVHNLEFRIDDLGQINFRARRNIAETDNERHSMSIKYAPKKKQAPVPPKPKDKKGKKR